jgi:putative glutamine amidotransferase
MNYMYEEYGRAVLKAGGAPVILPVAQDPETFNVLFERMDGLILSGGPDLNPKFYGDQPVHEMGDVDEDLDLMEIEAAKKALEKNIPVLGICRGLQVLNVSRGGTLFQDIPTQVKDAIGHNQKADKGTLTHSIRIEKGTLLHRIIRKGEIWVNGKHHQAVRRLSPDFIISARAPDGIVEAIEHPSKPFVLGVQWHPEGTWKNDAHSMRLFRAFVQEASRQP